MIDLLRQITRRFCKRGMIVFPFSINGKLFLSIVRDVCLTVSSHLTASAPDREIVNVIHNTIQVHTAHISVREPSSESARARARENKFDAIIAEMAPCRARRAPCSDYVLTVLIDSFPPPSPPASPPYLPYTSLQSRLVKRTS